MIKKRLQRLRGKSVRDLWQDRETRRIFGLLLAGKMIGILTLLGAIKGVSWYFGSAAGATPLQTPAAQTDSFVSPINTMWVLVTAFLVFFMQAGFMALEAGFARSRESVNVLLECVFDTCLCGLLYWAVGFAFQFGLGNGFIGHSYFFLNGAPDTYTYGGLLDTQVAFLAFFLFQFAFADTASTVTSGAMVGRTSFKGDILYSMAVSGLIYPIFAHWVWGPQGWLGNTMGWFSGFVGDGVFFRDFAGSTVVHTVGGA
ncbi:MAG: ammonium transporter, Amt family, partial [Acidimicrobiaceae bacterium]